MTRNNNVTMSSRSQSRSTRHQGSTSAIVSKISRCRTTQALKHDHTQFVCNALRVWKPMQINQGRCNVIKALQAKNQTSSRIQYKEYSRIQYKACSPLQVEAPLYSPPKKISIFCFSRAANIYIRSICKQALKK